MQNLAANYRNVAQRYKQAVRDRKTRVEQPVIDSKTAEKFHKVRNSKMSAQDIIGLLIDEDGNEISDENRKAKSDYSITI
jgi:hypothetical protein